MLSCPSSHRMRYRAEGGACTTSSMTPVRGGRSVDSDSTSMRSPALNSTPSPPHSVIALTSFVCGATAERSTAALEEGAFPRVLGPGDRRRVRLVRVGGAAQAPQEVGADRMEQVIAVEVEVVDERQRRIRSLDLRHGDRPVESYYRARGDREELVVEREDLPPVGVGCRRRVAVDGVDRRLDLVGTRPAQSEAPPDEGLAFRDELTIPKAAVLIGKQHEVAVRRGPGGPARLDEQHEREQPHDLRLVRHELRQKTAQAARTASYAIDTFRRGRTSPPAAPSCPSFAWLSARARRRSPSC